MKKPPSPGKARNIEYPENPSVQLANGLEVLCVPDRRLPRISLQAALPTGKVSDPSEVLGLTEVAAEMLKEGTAHLSSRDLAERFDRRAIHFDSTVYMEYGVLSMDLVSSSLGEAVELMGEILCRPSFPEEELAKVLVRYQGYLMSQMSDPGYLATERLFLDLFPGHPYSKITMRPRHLERIDRAGIADHYARLFQPGGFRLLFAGDIDLEKAAELSRSKLGAWKGGSAPAGPVEAPVQLRGGVGLVHRPHSAQAKVLVGFHGPSRTSDDYLPFTLMNQILGGGGSSRLFLNLREEKGLTYGAYSNFRAYRHSGVFFAGASVRSDSARVCIDEVLKEIDRLQQETPKEDELSRCKSELAGAFLRQMETPSGIGALELSRRIYQLPEDFYQNYLPRLRAITPSQIREQAQRHLDGDQSRIVIVGDRSQVEEQLSGLDSIQVYSVDGNAVD